MEEHDLIKCAELVFLSKTILDDVQHFVNFRYSGQETEAAYSKRKHLDVSPETIPSP